MQTITSLIPLPALFGIAALIIGAIVFFLWKGGFFQKGPKLTKEEEQKYAKGGLGLSSYTPISPAPPNSGQEVAVAVGPRGSGRERRTESHLPHRPGPPALSQVL